MNLSINELKCIKYYASIDKSIPNLALAMNLSNSQIYRILKNLTKKKILNKFGDFSLQTHLVLLIKLLSKFNNLVIPFSGTGLKIYSEFLTPKTIAEVSNKTKFHKTTIYKKLNQGRKLSVFVRKNDTYCLNYSIWPDLKVFFSSLKEYESFIDIRVPLNSVIYYKSDEEIIFSNKKILNASLTGFSVYENYGIKLYNITNYYFLPKKLLTIQEVFIHSLYVAEKECDSKYYLLVALFYLKFKTELTNLKHSIIDKLHLVFNRKKVKGYPSFKEVMDKAKMYNIKV